MIKVMFESGRILEYASIEDACVRQGILGDAPSRLTASGDSLSRIREATINLPFVVDGQKATWRGELAAFVWDHLGDF